MGFRILCCAVIVFSLSMAACAQSKPETVSFMDGQFEALKPASWSMLSDLNDKADLQMGNRFKEAYCTVLTEARIDFAEGLSLAEFSEITRKFLVDSLEDLQQTGPENLTLSGQPAIKYDLIGTINRTRIHYWHVSIETPTHYHQVILWSLPSRFKANQKDFEAVLNSIRTRGE